MLRYPESDGDGRVRMRRSCVLTDAMTFTEAEAVVMNSDGALDAEVLSMSRMAVEEALGTEDGCGRWFSMRVAFTFIDDTGKEVRPMRNTFLVYASDIDAARTAFMERARDFVTPYEVVAISDSRIDSVIYHG